MTEFRLSFEGLISYVPKREPGDRKPPDEVVMVMPDLRSPRSFAVGSEEDPNYEFTPPPHLPAVVVETRCVDPATTKDAALIYEKDGRRFGVYVFAMENVSFRVSDGTDLEFGRDPELDLEFSEKDPEYPPHEVDPKKEYDLRWVTSLEQIAEKYGAALRGAGVFDRSKLLSGDLPGQASQIVGTISLRQGVFRGLGVRRDDDGRVLTFPFSAVESDSTLFEKAVAKGTMNVVSTVQRHIDLLWTQADEDPQLLRVIAREDSAFVPIRFVNLELEAIVDVISTSPAHGEWDVDPAVIYRYSKYFDDFKHLALPVAQIPLAGRGNPSCDTLAFASWST